MNEVSKRPTPREMERAFYGRDGSYDGVFFVGVRTTGVFCVPSCAARKPLARNVEYFASTADAEAAGYRPCRRCRPERAASAAPAWIDGLLRRVDRDPSARLSDRDLTAMGLPPSRVRRYFRDRF
ncbi:MAG TPA: Ada metal-binding domain-containing protein, partial [Candidatus Krumholzibacteria bacterium]|nr:Ada metal-binding domain-containing protein [Candidatus Krumholzibacteria bacterium]